MQLLHRDRPVTRIDPGVVSLVAELRGHQRQAVEELEQWKTGVEERKVIDASRAAITLALLLTGEELDSMEKRAGDGEIAGRRRSGGSDVASLNRLRAMVRPPKYSPPMPRPSDGRPRVDGVICGSGTWPWQAAPQMGGRASADSRRWNLDLVLDQRGADMADLPGGARRLLWRTTRARKGTRRCTRSMPVYSPNCAATSGPATETHPAARVRPLRPSRTA